jgi:hypothetical protein
MDVRHLQSGRRDASAQPISSADSGERSVAQRGGRGRQPGLSSGRFVVADAAIYCVQGWILDIYTPSINRMSVLDAPLCLICIGYIIGYNGI